jgi:hypothetical protein
MRGDQRGEALLLHPPGQSRVARRARFGLEVAIGHFDWQRLVGYAVIRADRSDHRRLIGAFHPQTVIDRRRLDSPRQRGLGEQQQRQTVRPARNRHAQLALGKAQRGKIARETLGQFGRERPINCTSP